MRVTSSDSCRLLLVVTGLLAACEQDSPPAPRAPGVKTTATKPVSSQPVPTAAKADAKTSSPVPDQLIDPAKVPLTPKGRKSKEFAPEIALPQLDSPGTWRLSDHVRPGGGGSADAAVVMFMASNCGYCKLSLPTMRQMEIEYGDRVAFVIITTDKTEAARKQELSIVRQAGLKTPVLAADEMTKRAWLGASASIPRFFFVNKIGQILVQDRGFGRKVKPLIPKQIRAALDRPHYVSSG